LDIDTAYQLGLVNEDGLEILPVRVLNATAERLQDGTIHVLANAQTSTGGWQVYGDSQINGEVLNVNVKGTPPSGPATQALTPHKVEVNVRDATSIKQVVVRGDGDPITVALASPASDLSRQVKDQTAQLLNAYKE